MHIIRTAEEMAHAIAHPSDPEIATLLQVHADRLAGYDGFDLSELAMFTIVQPADPLEAIEDALTRPLLDEAGSFIPPVELIAKHGGWYEVTLILSDDGFGLVMFIPIDKATDPRLLKACERALVECASDGKP